MPYICSKCIDLSAFKPHTMKRKYFIGLICVVLFLFSTAAFGQRGNNGNPPPNPGRGGPPPPPGLPINTGITYLMLAGVAYGVYELRRNR